MSYEKLKHLPGQRGPFLIGHFREFLKNTTGLWKQMKAKYGDVYYIKILHRYSVNLTGMHTNKLILVDQAKDTQNKEAWETALSDLFPNSLMLMDGEEHKYHRSIMLDTFKKDAMQGYMDIMPDIIDHTMADLRSKNEIHFFPFYKLLTLRLATTVFFGLDNHTDLTQVNKAVSDIVNAAAAIPLKLPGTAYSRGINGRKYLMDFFKSLINERREQPGKDLFSKICLAKNEEGQKFSDQEIVDHLIFVLMASHDTTAITLSFLTYFLAKHPEWQASIREEVKGFDPDKAVVSELRSLEKLSLAMKETLRLHPPLTQVLRKLNRDFDIEGHQVPKGTVVTCTMQMTHIDPRIWTNPNDFDPERFNKDRREHMKCPFAYAPFGAGQHHCIGYAFAEMQIKLVMVALLKKYEISVSPDYIVPVKDVPMKQPTDDLPLYVKTNN